MVRYPSETILRVYDAVADPSLWPDVLQQFADEIDAMGCILFEWQGGPTQRRLVATIASAAYDPAIVSAYIEKCFEDEAHDQDLFEAHSLNTDGIDLIQDDVICPRVADLKQRPNVQRLQMLGILHRAAGLLNKDNRDLFRFSIQLGAHRGRLSPDEQQHIGAVLPHIAKALDLGRAAQQLTQAHVSLLAAMDRLTIGVCILDSAGRVVHSNEEFRRQEETLGVFSTEPKGLLRFGKPSNQRQFEALRSDLRNHGRFGARPRKEAIATDADTFLCIEMTPLTASEEIGSRPFGGAVLYSTDTSKALRCNASPMQRAFSLTDAEMGLVNLISQGLTNAQIAERRDRATATINAQVKSILSKTNCANRTQFVRLMMSFGADVLTKDPN